VIETRAARGRGPHIPSQSPAQTAPAWMSISRPPGRTLRMRSCRVGGSRDPKAERKQAMRTQRPFLPLTRDEPVHPP